MDCQLEIKFPKPAPEPSAQLTISETEVNMAFRFSYRVPEFHGKHLIGYRLEHISTSNVISKHDMYEMFGSAQKFVDALNYPDGAKVRLAKKLGFTDEQAALMTYSGFAVCEHFACTRVGVNDPRWV